MIRGATVTFGTVRGIRGVGRSSHRRGLGFPLSTPGQAPALSRSEEHTSELQSLMRSSYAVFCMKKKIKLDKIPINTIIHNVHDIFMKSNYYYHYTHPNPNRLNTLNSHNSL